MKRSFNVGLLAFFLAATAAAEETGAGQWVDDFNGGKPVNLLGQAAGAWVGDTTDGSVHVTGGFSEDHRRGEGGFALEIDFDLDSDQEQLAPFPTTTQDGIPQQRPYAASKTGYGGYTTHLGGLDARSYKYLTFWVKGDPEKGYTRRFRVELKDGQNLGAAWVEGISPVWRKFSFPLRRFSAIENWAGLDYIAFVFDGGVSKKEGAVYVDDIYFE